ncbi:CCR4-NOT transcription complex subunit 2-like [Patiria miniata]|uniref:CCR4-NOT transcription complex subunit 2 n=1 Tax=Patiria miniata TaxID=46514 RepID=A0A914BQR8_PATMI|nr:CCR4-NOT transcription complex subunit 2-like [Patiria miniata]XP_038078509.1 CCR4-NOT transcription complex subunit 2-like [Patiria miniata]
MSQESKNPPDLSLGEFGLLGGNFKIRSKMNFYKDGTENDLGDKSAYFPQSTMFPTHRSENDLLTSQSQSLSQYGIYGNQGYGLQQQQQPSGPPRGMPNPQQQPQQQQLPFPSRSMSGHHGSIGGQITPTPPSPSRGMLPVGPRVSQVQTSTNQPSMSAQSRVGTLGSGMPSPNSRTSPSLLAMQQKQQQQRMLGGSTQSAIGAFGMTRQQSYGGPQNTLLGNFTPQSLAASFNSVNESSPSLDMSDFPVLANRGRQQPPPQQQQHDNNSLSLFPPNPMAGRPAYVGMVNKQADPVPEFTMQSEDFPALPGTNIISKNSSEQNSTGVIKESPRYPGDKVANNNSNNDNQQKRGIQIHPDGKITHIPPGIVTDPFGIVGLLTFIRTAETDPNLVQLALGSDLTTLGLNLNSPENLYGTFQSPWAESPSRPQDIDFHVPQEYITNMHIRDKLAPIKLSRYGEDLLFYLYYTHGGDVLQLAAAAELYNRDWRYHKEERVWITRGPMMEPQVKTSLYERGLYYYFDHQRWCKVAKEFHLDYDKLEERPHLPASFHHNVSTNPVMAH